MTQSDTEKEDHLNAVGLEGAASQSSSNLISSVLLITTKDSNKEYNDGKRSADHDVGRVMVASQNRADGDAYREAEKDHPRWRNKTQQHERSGN